MTAHIVGLDIGYASVRGVEVSDAATNRPTLVRYHEVPLPEGAVNRGEVLEPNTVASALKLLWSTSGFKSKNVVLGIGNHRVVARDLTVPKMSLKLIREALPFQAQDMISVPVVDALLDFYPLSESDGKEGPQVNGLLVAAVKEAVQRNVHAVELAGLNPAGVDLTAFALSRAIFRGAPTGDAVVQVDVGAGTTTVVIAYGGVPQFVRLIPTGGADLTQALMQKLDLTAEDAEALKRTIGLAPTTPDNALASQIIRELTTELLNSLRNTVNYFVNTRNDVPVIRIVLTGGGASLGGFANALSAITRLPVVSPDSSQSIGLGKGVDTDAFKETQGRYLVALGLVLGSAA
jgi:type IV pilus assembly protein PilM